MNHCLRPDRIPLIIDNPDIFPGFFHIDLAGNVLPKLKMLQEFGFHRQIEQPQFLRRPHPAQCAARTGDKCTTTVARASCPWCRYADTSSW